jgi:predicted cupin superfamily sugar epimerase
MEFFEKSFVASQETDIFYNQIAGTDMSAYFREKELQRIEVRKNANVLYFMKEAEKFNGINKAESDKIIFYLKDKKLDAVLFPTKSKGGMYPIKTTKPVDMYLTDFKWQKEIRPKDKNDIF